MAGIEDKLKNVRTLEDIVNVLAILFNNMNTLSRNYYDLFVNPDPMTIPMKLYDENGNLVPKDIPNIASYKTSVILNDGNPNGYQEGNMGSLCLDYSNSDLYYKTTDGGNNGWLRLYDSDDNFLAPDGDGSGLVNLDAAQIESGVLPVERGGTGNEETFEGLVYNDGSKYRKAVEGVDYSFVTPASLTGVVSYFAGSIDKVPSGWLVCDGSTLPINDTYRRLFNIIGTTYGGDGENTFNLPNLISGNGMYIKCGNEVSGTVTDATVGGHVHSYSGNTGLENTHTHDRGSYDITGVAGMSWCSNTKNWARNPVNNTQMTGCFFEIETGYSYNFSNKRFINDGTKYYGINDGSTTNNDPGMGFQASLSWTGKSGTGSAHRHSISGMTDLNNSIEVENDVKHMTMIPIIKY